MLVNVDEQEIAKFSAHANEWWDKDGPFKTLHQINQTRLEFILNHQSLAHKNILDIGCGGGLLSEALAEKGANVVGLDQDHKALEVARQHAQQQGLQIRYIATIAEDYAATHAQQYDIVTCLEMLEHVPDPVSIVKACSLLIKPNGMIFFSTINRNWLSYCLAIAGAEYVLKLLPRGTHDYAKFIKPSELDQWARRYELQLVDMAGIAYNPLNHSSHLITSVQTNFIVCYKYPAENSI